MPRNESLSLDLAETREILSVSALNREARRVLEGSFGRIWVEGEISNLARPSSGHLYWSLKDARAQVRCAMFRSSHRGRSVDPQDGMQVVVRGRISLYEPRGDYQLIVDQIEDAGEGALQRRFEALKRKLAAEGLFDPERKRELPRIPQRIGVVTSPTGAAIRDVLISLRRRFPAAHVLLYPTSVQGDKAAGEIVAALERASQRAECNLLILTRGGGSLEDLWPFNEEAVARAVRATSIPIIVGVGHETDFTIAEFAADLRAPTPSQAAEFAVPQQSDYLARTQAVEAMLERILLRRLRDEQRKLDVLEHRLARTHPGVILKTNRDRLAALEHRLQRAHPGNIVVATRQQIDERRLRLQQAIARLITDLNGRARLVERALTALSPLATLERGYAIVSRKDDSTLVTDSGMVSPGSPIDVRLAQGELTATVDSTRPGKDR
jgi:exodeoxyribonuclease VII large subunit